MKWIVFIALGVAGSLLANQYGLFPLIVTLVVLLIILAAIKR